MRKETSPERPCLVCGEPTVFWVQLYRTEGEILKLLKFDLKLFLCRRHFSWGELIADVSKLEANLKAFRILGFTLLVKALLKVKEQMPDE